MSFLCTWEVEGKKKGIHSVQVLGSNDNREHMPFLIGYSITTTLKDFNSIKSISVLKDKVITDYLL